MPLTSLRALGVVYFTANDSLLSIRVPAIIRTVQVPAGASGPNRWWQCVFQSVVLMVCLC